MADATANMNPAGGIAKAPNDREDGVRQAKRLGLLTLAGLAGAFALWAGIAPLDSAVVAPGEVTVEHDRKTLKHPRGGIVVEQFVVEGASVDAGDVLLRLDDTDARATIALLSARRATLEATIARLAAEQRSETAVAFPADLRTRAASYAEVARAIAAERYVFESRAAALADEMSVLESRIEQMQEVIAGSRLQIDAAERQKALITEERDATQQLFDKGYAPKTRLLALKRGIAQFDGRIGELRATIAQSQAAIGEARKTMIQLESGRTADIARQAQEAQTQLAEVSARLASAQRNLEISEIRAPVAGTVFDLRSHTVGGVVNAGEPILDIVPLKASLVVSGRMSTADADEVHAGMAAEVRLSGVSEINKPVLDATVEQVSADRLTDERSGEPYFEITVRVDETTLAEAGNPSFFPGMRADIIVGTGERTAFDFLFGPVLDSLYFSTRER